MREIKFQCWNGEAMVSPDYVDRDGFAHWKENSIPTNSNELMQYTGLNDKNGNEIYEGDILLCDGAKRIVEWDTYRWIVAHFDHSRKKCIAKFHPDKWHKFEVIGNNYENPGLLKKK